MKIPHENTQHYENLPAGTYAARCIRFIDLGSHDQTYQGESKGKKRLVLLTFEVPSERMDDGRPFSISKRYTWSMHEKSTLRKHLEAWRGQKFQPTDFGTFDIRNVLNKECMLSVVEWGDEQRGGTAIDSISKIIKGLEVAPAENDIVYFSLDPNEFDAATLDSLSDNLKETIRQSPEYASVRGGGTRHSSMGANDGTHYDERNPPPASDQDYASMSGGY